MGLVTVEARVLADICDAIDPATSPERRVVVIRRALQVDGEFALAAVCGLLRGMLEGMLEAGADPDLVMVKIRRDTAGILDRMDGGAG